MSCKAKRSVRMLITSSPFGDQVGKICTGTKRPRLLASNRSPWHDRVGNFLSAASKCPLNHLHLQTTLYNINKSNVAKTGGRLAHLTGPWTANQSNESNESNMISMVQPGTVLCLSGTEIIIKQWPLWRKRTAAHAPNPSFSSFVLAMSLQKIVVPCCSFSFARCASLALKPLELALSNASCFAAAQMQWKAISRISNRQTQKKHTNFHPKTKHSSWKTSKCLMR